MSIDTDSLSGRELLEFLSSCDSRDEIHRIIRSWLRANPRPPTLEQHLARVDEVLAESYRPPGGYDPRIVGPVLEALTEIVARMVRESGRADAIDQFDAREWVSEWAHHPHPALGGTCPVHVLHTPEGVDQVRRLLMQQQSGAYA